VVNEIRVFPRSDINSAGCDIFAAPAYQFVGSKIVGRGVLGRAGRLCIRTVGCGIADAPAIILALIIELDTPTLPSEACCHFDQ
jgi:hypothetical protein